MHMVMQNELGNAEPYFAAVSPVLDLTVIRPDDAPHILPCFDEADEGMPKRKSWLNKSLPKKIPFNLNQPMN